MKPNKQGKLIEIFAGTVIEAEMVKSLLQDSEIEAFLKDENIGTIAPWQASAGGAGSVKVVISDLDYARAKVVMDEYYKNTRKVE